MKPNAEQVEAARFFLYDWQMSGETVDDLAIRIAARDAERDARWENKMSGLVRALERYALHCQAETPFKHKPILGSNQHYSDCFWCEAKAALANLGAEEKPKHDHDGYCERCFSAVSPPEPKCRGKQ